MIRVYQLKNLWIEWVSNLQMRRVRRRRSFSISLGMRQWMKIQMT